MDWITLSVLIAKTHMQATVLGMTCTGIHTADCRITQSCSFLQIWVSVVKSAGATVAYILSSFWTPDWVSRYQISRNTTKHDHFFNEFACRIRQLYKDCLIQTLVNLLPSHLYVDRHYLSFYEETAVLAKPYIGRDIKIDLEWQCSKA